MKIRQKLVYCVDCKTDLRRENENYHVNQGHRLELLYKEIEIPDGKRVVSFAELGKLREKGGRDV